MEDSRGLKWLAETDQITARKSGQLYVHGSKNKPVPFEVLVLEGEVMSQGKRAVLSAALVAVLTLVSGFLVFLYSYNSITSPVLTDEQRFEGAKFVFSVTLPSYLAISVVIGVLVFFLLRRRS